MIVSKSNEQMYTNPLTHVRSNSGKTLGWKPIFVNTFSKGNTDNIRYFSGLEAEIYFGDIYIDEAVQIDFNVQQNTMPLFGYNSHVYDDISLGSRLITGRFVLNFTRSNYLYTVLETLKKASIKSGDKTVIANTDNTLEQYDDNVKTRLANVTQDPVVLYKHSPLWNCSFDIWCSYGNGKQNAVGSTIIILKDVTLNGCSQQVSISGEPIFEEYSFIAKDIQFTQLNSNTTTESTSSESVTEEENVKLLSTTYNVVTDIDNKYGYLNIQYSSSVPVVDIGVMIEVNNNKTWVRTSSGGDRISSLTGSSSITYNKKYRVSNDLRIAIEKNEQESFPVLLKFYYYPNGQTQESSCQVEATAKLTY